MSEKVLHGTRSESRERIAIVAGLGNPGERYQDTRHNVGFQVIDHLARDHGVVLQARKFRAQWGAGHIEDRKILLLKPLTFMNRSGEAVSEVLKYFGIPGTLMLVVHDDLDLPTGRIKVAAGGGAGGHRGILSIMEHLGNRDFPRVKLGIGRPAHGEPVEAYVLGPPYAGERAVFKEMVVRGAEAVRTVISMGIAAAANRFNCRDSGRTDGAPC